MTQRSIDNIHTHRKKIITRRATIHAVIDSYSRMIVGWDVRFVWQTTCFYRPDWKAVVERQFAGSLQNWTAGRLRRKADKAKRDPALTKTRRTI